MVSLDALDRHYFAAVELAAASVGTLFRREPASFLYEHDLSALLFGRLFDCRAHLPLSWEPSEVELGGIERPRLLVNPVKAEYPYAVGDGSRSEERFDVALLARDRARGRNAWGQLARVGIEVKLWQANGGGLGFHGDLKKLKQYADLLTGQGMSFAGLTLLFCHRESDALRDEVDEVSVVRNPECPRLADGAVQTWAFVP